MLTASAVFGGVLLVVVKVLVLEIIPIAPSHRTLLRPVR